MIALIGLFSLLSTTDVEIVEEVESIVISLQLEAKGMGFRTPWASRELFFKVLDIPTNEHGTPQVIGYVTYMPTILHIDRGTWLRADFYFKEMLVAHELAHARLLRPHVKECRVQRDLNGYCAYPVSLMYPSLSATDYVTNRTYYLMELFSIYYDDFQALLDYDRKEGDRKP